MWIFDCSGYFLLSRSLDSNFGSLRFLRGLVIAVSVILVHLTLEFHSLLIRTTLHFILLRRLCIEFLSAFDCENG